MRRGAEEILENVVWCISQLDEETLQAVQNLPVLEMAARSRTDQGLATPAAAVTSAIVTNTLVKLGIALVAGARRFRLYVPLALVH